jgi:RNA polymerase sigma-70 factor (ECF subfamily)
MEGTDWGVIYERQVGFVQYVLSRCGIHPPEADDFVQEVFMRLMRGSTAFENERALQGWLAVTTRRLVIDGVRRRRRRPEEGGVEAAIPDDRATPETLVDALTFAQVLKVVDKEDGGGLLRKHYLEDKGVQDIAREIGAPVGTVTARLSRLRARLRERLK